MIADTFAQWATAGFDHGEVLNFFEAWATSLSYTFQLYFDFSGYTDMAIGAALLFNIKLPINFNSPYKALDIQDFWRRWHITLSRFLRDYIYIPLGGNRKGSFRTYLNLLATFILGGIWHGAGWTFIFWGFLHGMALVIQRLWTLSGFSMPRFLAWFITFNFVNVAWVFFRAKDWNDALKVLHGMIDIQNIIVSQNFVTTYNHTIKHLSVLMPEIQGAAPKVFSLGFETYLWIGLILYTVVKLPNTYQIMRYPTMDKSEIFSAKYALIFSAIFLISLLSMSISTYSEFIYFNF